MGKAIAQLASRIVGRVSKGMRNRYILVKKRLLDLVCIHLLGYVATLLLPTLLRYKWLLNAKQWRACNLRWYSRMIFSSTILILGIIFDRAIKNR